MKVIITSKNFNASDHLKQLIENKFEKLGKYFSDNIVVNIMLTTERGREKVEATINAKGTIFRAEEESSDAYTAVDKVVDKLSTQMSRFKTKLQRKHRGQKEFIFTELPDTDDDLEEIKPVKTKSFELLPMSVDEAVMQMELLEHDFFAFLNMETNSVNIVYKRKDNNYGLLKTYY
ncbi:ribosome hibernation-promoting factor, HPF/YfiA family [Anaerovorax odorimutans]|uniref:ribosome hibernation-promoting factor, HPF/YfiA family n=1 Tax=Anaerovorax odorimutans TaxID=109327 RepID=UPI0003FBBABA|nr:ribosome-associated translation inhibitor RaiA [Anaerovorax odorimutans]